MIDTDLNILERTPNRLIRQSRSGRHRWIIVRVTGAAVIVVLASAALAAQSDDTAVAVRDVAPGKIASSAEQTFRQSGQNSVTEPRVRAAQRGRWGVAVGITRFGGEGTYDYRNAPTPLAGATGPYPNAVIKVDHDWVGPYVSAGYRGPFGQARKFGFGLEGQVAFTSSALPDAQVTAASPTGVRVTFSTEKGGIQGLMTFAGTGNLSYSVLPSFNIVAGGKVSYLLVKSSWGSYKGLGPPIGSAFFGEGSWPVFSTVAITPWAGAEYLFSNHVGVEVAADFLPRRTEHLTDTPWVLTFQRHRLSLTAAIRFFI